MQQLKDIFSLFKIDIIENANTLLYILVSLILFAYASVFLQNTPLPIIGFLQKNSPLIKKLFDLLRDRMKRGRCYKFTERSWYKDWIYNGKVKVLNESTPILRVTSTRAGCLLAKHLWKNFEMKFHMKFIETDWRIGIIFRAKDLENYFMLEVIKKTESIIIKPHIRYSGMWEILSQDTIGPHHQFEWLNMHLIVKDKKVLLSIEGVGNYEWNLPTHVDINHIEDGIKKTQNSNSESDENFSAKTSSLPEIEFSETFGMIGFRAHLYQGADIKGLTVNAIK